MNLQQVQEIQEIVSQLHSFKEEHDLSKKFKEKTTHIISILVSNDSLAVEKALLALEELNSSDIPSYHRTKVWDLISLLESTKN